MTKWHSSIISSLQLPNFNYILTTPFIEDITGIEGILYGLCINLGCFFFLELVGVESYDTVHRETSWNENRHTSSSASSKNLGASKIQERYQHFSILLKTFFQYLYSNSLPSREIFLGWLFVYYILKMSYLR